MATTTATITLSSSDLLTDNLSLSATMNLYKGGTTSTGLDELNYHPHNKEGEQMHWIVETRGGSFILSCAYLELEKYVKINK